MAVIRLPQHGVLQEQPSRGQAVSSPPRFETYDAWFIWICEQLAQSDWRSEATQFAVRQLFETYTDAKTKPPLSDFLATKAHGLSDDVRQRLRAYVLAWPVFMNARKKPHVVALVDALSTADRPLRFLVER